jgi:hypothetical protein
MTHVTASPRATSAAQVFAVLWEELADVLGTAATATLVRRAVRDAGLDRPGPPPVVVNPTPLSYEYCVPDAWRDAGDPEALASLQAVAGQLAGLLRELTGDVVLRRLARAPVLRDAGLPLGAPAP